MTSEPPEFHTKIRTPVSPLPVRPPNPLDIPVLRNQIDPTFNMTTTHEETKKPDDSPLSDTRFSDAYDEKDEEITGDKIEDEEAEASDDYAMTFESDGEENTDSHDQSQAVDQEPKNSSNIVPPSDLPTSIPNERPPISYSQSGPEIQPAPAIPSPTLPTNSESAAAQSSDDPSHTSTIATNPIAPEDPTGGIDIQQLLDNITANAEINAAAARPSSSSSSNAPPLKSGSSLPTHASLPPRPQVTQQPLPKRSNYPSYDDAYKYNAGAQGYSHAPTSYRPSGVTPSLIASGAPGTATDSRYGLPPPPSVSFSQSNQDPNSPKPYRQSQRMTSVASSEGHDDERPWGPAVQKIYDEFLDRERKYVTEGLWERFPKGSRLFIGNLPSEKLTKRDLFHVFHKYGELAQISIKQAYGFVQFHDSAACYRALDMEQGKEVRGRKMHLEISKAQKNTRNAQNGPQAQGRSRSPDHARNGSNGRGRNNQHEGRNSGYNHNDRYGSQQQYDRPQRTRDDYRPGRSPSPSRGYRGRDEYTSRNRDSYNGRDRRRSRSPIQSTNNGRYRDRSPSPRSREANDDAILQIPRRDPSNVPDVQIILMTELDRGFVSWVEGEMRGRGVKTEVMFLSPRLPLQAVIRRQILEGVLAVSQLDMRSQNASKIPLQVFDRQGGSNAVRFDEYQDLEPKIAAELVVRAKSTQQQPQYPSNTAPAYQAPLTAQNANLAGLVGQLDNSALQKLLGTLNSMPQQNPSAASANAAIDIAGLLSGFTQQQQQPQQAQPPSQQAYPQAQPPADPYAAYNSNAAYGAAANGYPAPDQNGQSAQQVQNIMAQLARFRQ